MVPQRENSVSVCTDCGNVICGDQVCPASQWDNVEQIEVLQTPANSIHLPVLVAGTEIIVEEERVIAVKTPHDGVRGNSNVRLNHPQDMLEGLKMIKVNVPHSLSKDRKFIKLLPP